MPIRCSSMQGLQNMVSASERLCTCEEWERSAENEKEKKRLTHLSRFIFSEKSMQLASGGCPKPHAGMVHLISRQMGRGASRGN